MCLWKNSSISFKNSGTWSPFKFLSKAITIIRMLLSTSKKLDAFQNLLLTMSHFRRTTPSSPKKARRGWLMKTKQSNTSPSESHRRYSNWSVGLSNLSPKPRKSLKLRLYIADKFFLLTKEVKLNMDTAATNRQSDSKGWCLTKVLVTQVLYPIMCLGQIRFRCRWGCQCRCQFQCRHRTRWFLHINRNRIKIGLPPRNLTTKLPRSYNYWIKRQ